jgi:hypothetical protein
MCPLIGHCKRLTCGIPLIQDGIVLFIADLEIEAARLLDLRTQGGFTMNHVARLQLIGRVTYYVGWIALVCGGLVHLSIAQTLFSTVNLSKRNLFEVAAVCFLICIASELRAHASPGKDLSIAATKAT